MPQQVMSSLERKRRHRRLMAQLGEVRIEVRLPLTIAARLQASAENAGHSRSVELAALLEEALAARSRERRRARGD